jgi:hypothetical protein
MPLLTPTINYGLNLLGAKVSFNSLASTGHGLVTAIVLGAGGRGL